MTDEKNIPLKSSEKKRGALHRDDTPHVESQDNLAQNTGEEEE